MKITHTSLLLLTLLSTLGGPVMAADQAQPVQVASADTDTPEPASDSDDCD